MLDYLLYKAPKSANGIIYLTLNSPEIWIDAMYMAPPLLASIGKYDEAIKQIKSYHEILWNKENKLYSHRWHDEKKEFVNKKFWGVGNGWALAGIARVINKLPEDFVEKKEQLIKMLLGHLDSCLLYMRPDGLFHDIIDDNDSFVETNLGQMIAYTIYNAWHSGWLLKSYQTQVDKMRQAAHNKVDELGFVQGVCGAPHFNSPGRATEGQAFFILMEVAYSKM